MTLIEQGFLWAGLFVAAVSFIHLLRVDYWWIRIWDFPHLQLVALSAVVLTGWLIFVHDFTWPHVVVPLLIGAALLYQSWLIYPYTPLHRRQVLSVQRRNGRNGTPTAGTSRGVSAGNAAQPNLDEQTVRLLVANVLMTNTSCPQVLSLAQRHNPDLILILEANAQWRNELRPLEEAYPYQLLHPLENTYGMLFYSRLPVQESQLRFLIQDDIPSIYVRLELPSGQPVHFYGVHPMPPSPTEHYRSTERDAELVLVGREARRQRGPVIVAGDLNDVAWSHTTRLFQRLSGLLDPRVGRGLYSTFHANYFFLRWPLDHVFVSHHFRLRQLRRLPNCGSDHFPIFVSLAYQPDASRVSEVPQPEHDDLQEAAEKVQEAKS